MSAFQIMLTIAIVIYWSFTIAIFKIFGIPDSYSNTFYLLNEKKKGLGVLFPIMLLLTIGLILPGWLEVSELILPNITFLVFFGGAGLLFVAAAPFFKEMSIDTGKPIKDLIYRSFHGQGLIHTIGALLSMISIVIWTSISPYWWILLVIVGLIILIGICTSSLFKSIVFWVEFMLFNTMFIVLSIAYLLL